MEDEGGLETGTGRGSFKYKNLSGQRFNEVERLENAWDASIEVAKGDLSLIENRRRLKSILKWIDAFLYPYTKSNDDYQANMESLRMMKPTTLDQEINQMYSLMKLERLAQTKTKLNPPKSVEYTIRWDEPSDCPVITSTQRILREQGTSTTIFIGKPGGGKSYSAMTFSHQVKPPFSLGKCFFETEEFFKTINTFKDRFGNDVESTDMLNWEELGIVADNREFMSLKNKVISKALDVWRKKNLGLVLTMPTLDNLDSRIENRLDWIFEVKDFEKTPEGKLLWTTFNVLVSQHNPIIKKTYKKHPIYWVDGEEIMISEITIYPPPEDIIAQYNAMSDECKSKILKGLESDLKNYNEKAEIKAQTFNFDESIAMVMKHKDEPDFISSMGKFRSAKIRELLSCSERRADEIRDRIGTVHPKTHTQGV